MKRLIEIIVCGVLLLPLYPFESAKADYLQDASYFEDEEVRSANYQWEEPDRKKLYPIEKAPVLGDEDIFEEKFSLNAKGLEISSLVKLVSKLSGRNYILDERVRGKVTIHQSRAQPLDEVLKTFETVLLHKGFTSVPLGNNTWRIVAAEDAKQTTIPLLTSSSGLNRGALVTRLVRLENAEALKIRSTVEKFVSQHGTVEADNSTNSLIIVDSNDNTERVISLIKELDIPAEKNITKVVYLRNADALDVAEKLSRIINNQNQTETSVIIDPDSRKKKITKKQDAGPEVIANERTNSIIIVGSANTVSYLEELTNELDSPIDRSGEKFYIYKLKHANAEEILEVLSPLISDDATKPARAKNSQRGSSLSRLKNARSLPKGSKLKSSSSKVSFEEKVSLAADIRTNSIIINSSEEDYKKIKALIRGLDVRRKQVLVEAAVVEVSMGDSQELGVEFASAVESGDDGVGVFQNNLTDLSGFFSNPTSIQGFTAAALSSGTVKLPNGTVLPKHSVFLNALKRNSNVNVLSSPSILTSDNEEAEIIVGENVPIITSVSTDPSNLDNTFRQIERHDVGITLRITPQITNGDDITLKIFVEISAVVPGTRAADNGLTTTIRTTETSVVVKNNQMVVTGGLLADNVTESVSGIPLLMDIPGLGSLFSSEEENVEQTNLLIFITPKIIEDSIKAQQITDAYTQKMPKVRDYMKREKLYDYGSDLDF